MDGIIGHVTLRIPIHAYTESESSEIPEEYTVEHDMPAGWHVHLRQPLAESCAYVPDEDVNLRRAAHQRSRPTHGQ